MKFVYFYNEFGVPDVKADMKYIRLADVLTDANHETEIDEILNGLEELKTPEAEWDMSFNKSYVNMTSERVRCGDLYNEDDYIDVTHSQLKEALNSWKVFLTNKKLKNMEVKIKNQGVRLD